jgi:hypothetical protein
MYRPQFAYATPAGCIDKDFVYYFDGVNTPWLASLAAGQVIENIPLTLEQDAPFYWRGWKFQIRNTVTEGPASIVTYPFPDADIRLRDVYSNDLQSTWVPATLQGFPQNPVQFSGQKLTGPPTLLEPEIYCPAGGVLLAFLRGGPTLVGANFCQLSLFGVKRFKGCA